jgi:formate hydrogenlyase transcriptional activator
MELLQNVSILVIDDELLNLMMLEDFLLYRCKQLWLETNTDAALVLAQQQQPDVILLDILMNPVDGYQVCRQLKENPATAEIPVIFLSSLIRASDKVKGFHVGAVDYISKPFHIEEVVARVENVIRLNQKIQQKQSVSAQEIAEKIDAYQLSERELGIFKLYALGKQRNEIAQALFISENTVKTYLRRLFTKLKVNNRTQVIEKAYQMGLINRE